MTDIYIYIPIITAFVLADEGYDVWLGNHRGTTYSKDHMELAAWNNEYWDFGMHEIGIYDLPATIQYINGITGNVLLESTRT